MKKIFSIVLALGLMTGAYALPFTGITRSLEQNDARTIVAKQSHKVLPAERIDLTQLSTDKVPFAMQSNTVRATKRQAGNPITVNDTIDGAFMLYLYNYYYYMQGSDIGNAWELQVTCRNGLELWLDFNTVADNRIEGVWHNVMGLAIMGTDTFDVSGVLDINYKSAAEEGFSPVYTFEGQFVDGSGNTFNLAGDYAFADGYVFDYLFYQFCYELKQYCEMVDIYLVDEPVIPSGESVDLTISNAANKAFYADEGGWYVTAKDADAFASFQVYSTELKGSFTTKDLDYTYTSLVSFADGDTTEIDIYKPLSLDITEKNDTSFYDLSMLGMMDGVTYNVTMFYPNPVITDTIDIRLQGELKFLGTDGIYIAEAYDANQDTVVSLGLNTKTITGTFTELNFYGGNSNNLIAFRGEKNYTIYYEDKATIQLDSLRGQDGQAYFGYYVCTMLIDGYNANDRKDSHCFRVQLLLRNPYEGQAEKDLTVTLEADPTQLFDTTEFAQYGYIYIKYYDASCNFYTVAFPERCDKDYMLPLGTYNFSNSWKVGTMLQSAGWNEEWYPTYSFYQDATTTDTWFMFAGTATMTENSLIFNAVNLNENKIKITINFVTSGIEEVMQAADQLQLKKVMENGNLYIIRDNKAYNAAGFRIK